MGFWKKFKNKEDLLSREHGEYFFRIGEKFISRLKIDEKIRKANKYGNEKPQMAFLLIFLLIALMFGLGSLYEAGDYVPQLNHVDAPTPPVVDKFQMKMEALKNEFFAISDTLTKVMEKETLTAEDSVFIMEKYQRLEEIDKIINTKFNNEN